MTPKEKADSLIEQIKPFAEWGPSDLEMELDNAIKCALIAVREIQNINSVDKDYILSNYWILVEKELLIIYNKKI